jgi:DNA-binding NarL/FixJ family response regulator
VQITSGRSCVGVRVIVVDATRIGSESPAARLKKDRCVAVYTGTSAKDALSVVADADVALISAAIEGDPEKGYELARQIRLLASNVQVVIMVDRSDSHSVVQAFRSGARGIFGRDGSLELISKCVSRVSQGQVWARSEELQHLLEALAAPPRMRLMNSSGVEILAPREQEVVHWVSEGLSNREIAEQMQLSANTVKNYLFRIFDKLGISNRVELILFAATQMNNAASKPPANGSGVVSRKVLEFQNCLEFADKAMLPQYLLAEMYLNGRNVPPHKATALMWFILAEHTSAEFLAKSREARAQLVRELTPREVTEGKQRAEEWIAEREASPVKFPDDNDEVDRPAISAKASIG